MIFPKAKKIAREHGWHKTKNGVFGLYKGYFFNVYDASILSNPQYKFVDAATGELSEEQQAGIREALTNHKRELKFTEYTLEEDEISFQFAETLTLTKLKTVYALMDFLVDLFKKLGIPQQEYCHGCGTKLKLKYCTIGYKGAIRCDSCFRVLEKTFDEMEREKRTTEKNYFSGFVGSVLFSLPAIIGWVLLAVYLERLASAMAIFIALLGLKGYNYFKGVHGPWTKFVIVFSNIVCIVLANAATVIALIMREGLSFSQSVTEFMNNDLALEMFRDNLVTSFILAFFVWIWLLFLLTNARLSIKLAEKF